MTAPVRDELPRLAWYAVTGSDFAAIERLDLPTDDARCLGCGEGIGVVLVGDEDRPCWRTVIVVELQGPKPDRLLCEDCGALLNLLADGPAVKAP